MGQLFKGKISCSVVAFVLLFAIAHLSMDILAATFLIDAEVWVNEKCAKKNTTVYFMSQMKKTTYAQLKHIILEYTASLFKNHKSC